MCDTINSTLGVADENENVPYFNQYLFLRTCRGGANIQKWRSLEARRLLSQSYLVRHRNFLKLHGAKKKHSDVKELNGTYIGHDGTQDELSSLRYNDTANTSNFSVGLFAKDLGSRNNPDIFFFTYFGDEHRVPQQWSICYCLPQLRLTLVGNIPGILGLHSNFFPTASKIPPGVPMEWDTFITDANGKLSIDDGSALQTRYWVAYKGSKDPVYNIGLYDGKRSKSR
jgi:hypothetical protein